MKDTEGDFSDLKTNASHALSVSSVSSVDYISGSLTFLIAAGMAYRRIFHLLLRETSR